MNAETIALILTPLVVGAGTWLTWLLAVRNNTQDDIQTLLDQHAKEINRLRAHLFERDRLAQDTWSEVIELRRRVLDLEHQLRDLYHEAMQLYAQVVELGANPIVKPMKLNKERD